jgi:hypothetical protein
MRKLMQGNEFSTRPVRAEELVPGMVVNLKGGPAVVYGWGELPLSGRIVLGLRDVFTAPAGEVAEMWIGWTPLALSEITPDREVVVSAGTRYPVFPDRAEGF